MKLAILGKLIRIRFKGVTSNPDSASSLRVDVNVSKPSRPPMSKDITIKPQQMPKSFCSDQLLGRTDTTNRHLNM
jgi:hypothetical protein